MSRHRRAACRQITPPDPKYSTLHETGAGPIPTGELRFVSSPQLPAYRYPFISDVPSIIKRRCVDALELLAAPANSDPNRQSPFGEVVNCGKDFRGQNCRAMWQNLLRQRMALGYTVHGFRSSFMDWVAEVHPQRLLEAERALDHQIGNQVQRAYLRTDFLEQRRELAELWAGHLTGS